MASKTITTEAIRARKHAPNKVNLKTDDKRIRANLEVLQRVSEPESKSK